MEIAFTLKQPLNIVLSSLEHSLKKSLVYYDSQDFQVLKADVQQFQKNVMKQIETFNQNLVSQPSNVTRSDNRDKLERMNGSSQIPSKPQQKQTQDKNNLKLPSKRKGDVDSDSYSEYNSSESKDQQVKQTAANKLTPKEQKFIVKYFNQHYDPSKRNKMQLVKECQSQVNTSQNAIYNFVQSVIEDMMKKNPKYRNKYYKRDSYTPNGPQQFNNKQQRDISDEEEDDEMMQDQVEYEFDNDKEDLNFDEINELIKKYENHGSQNNQKEQTPKQTSRSLKYQEDDYQLLHSETTDINRKSESSDSRQNTETSAFVTKVERCQETPKILRMNPRERQLSQQSQNEEPYLKNRSSQNHYSEQREVPYESTEEYDRKQY